MDTLHGVIRISIVYRERAVPLVWKVIEHASSSVEFQTYRPLLDQAWEILSECGCYDIVMLAERGFADTEFMGYSRLLFLTSHPSVSLSARHCLPVKHLPCELCQSIRFFVVNQGFLQRTHE